MALLQLTDFDNAQQDLLFIEEVGTSEENTLTSRNGYETDTRIGRLKRLGLTPVVSGAAWAAGIEFTNYEQYLIYDDYVYTVDRTVSVPVTTAATPDSNFVVLESVPNGISNTNYDNYNTERLHKFTNLDFNTVADMQSLTTISGNVVEVVEGSMLTVSNGSTKEKTPFVVIDGGDIEVGDTTFLLDNGLYAKQLTYSLDPSLTSPIRNLSTTYDNMDTRGPDFNFYGNEDSNGVTAQRNGCIGADGLIYYPDASFSSTPVVLAYNSKTKSTKSIDLSSSTGTPSAFNWVLGSDGNIYIPPSDTSTPEYVVVLDTKDMTFTELEVTHVTGGKSYQYGGGVLADDGIAYWFPQQSDGEMGILKVNTSLGYIDEFIDNETVYGGGRFNNACIEPNGNIILAPATGTSFLYLDRTDDSLNSFGTITAGTGIGSFTNILVGSDGFVYAIPYVYTHIVKIDPGSYTVSDYEYIEPVSGDTPDINSSCIGPNGLLYTSSAGTVSNLFLEIDLPNATFNEYTFLNDNMPSYGYPFATILSMRVDKYGTIVAFSNTRLGEIRNLNNDQDWTKSAYVQ